MALAILQYCSGLFQNEFSDTAKLKTSFHSSFDLFYPIQSVVKVLGKKLVFCSYVLSGQLL
jgi:hypothetical protein